MRTIPLTSAPTSLFFSPIQQRLYVRTTDNIVSITNDRVAESVAVPDGGGSTGLVAGRAQIYASFLTNKVLAAYDPTTKAIAARIARSRPTVGRWPTTRRWASSSQRTWAATQRAARTPRVT